MQNVMSDEEMVIPVVYTDEEGQEQPPITIMKLARN
jgi:hypothetical protein